MANKGKESFRFVLRYVDEFRESRPMHQLQCNNYLQDQTTSNSGNTKSFFDVTLFDDDNIYMCVCTYTWWNDYILKLSLR